MSSYRSDCCAARIVVREVPKEPGVRGKFTHFYECHRCGKKCSPMPPK